MLHRHLHHQRFTLAAIDDVISRGRWQDWADLRRAALRDEALLDGIERWQDWNTVKAACARVAVAVFDRVCDAAPP